jgi:hypothetical protein
MTAEMQALIDRLENYYQFACEGGPLKSCVEWQRLSALLRDDGLGVALLRLAQVEAERDRYQRGCREWNERFEAWRGECAQRAEAAEQQIAQLTRWKKSAMKVLSAWHRLGDALRLRYPIKPGEDTPTALLAAIKKETK